MARLIRTEKEVEGRYEEVWTVVEEDALDQWPAGPLDVVGRPARAPGRAAARPRRGAVHGRRRAARDAARRRPPQPARRARAFARPRPGARAAGRPRGRLVPATSTSSRSEAGYPGAAVAAVAADTFEQAQAAVEAIAVEWEVLEPLLDPDEAVARGQLLEEPSRYERGDVDGALATADVVVEAEYRTQSVLHNAFETHCAVCEWKADTLDVLHLDAVHLGRPLRRRRRVRAPARPRARRLRVHGRRLRREERRRRLHAHRGRAGAAHRPARAVRAHAAARRTSPRATATPPSSGCASARARTARSSASAASS